MNLKKLIQAKRKEYDEKESGMHGSNMFILAVSILSIVISIVALTMK